MKTFFWAGLTALTGIGLTLLAGWLSGAKMNVLTGDIFLITRTPSFVALLSNVGAFAWFASVVLLAFAVSIARRREAHAQLAFLVSSLVLSLVLFLDDFFMLHDYWIRIVLGKVDAYYYAALAASVAAYLVVFRRTIWESQFLLLGAALSLFAASVGMDLLQDATTRRIGHWQYLLEDGAKWAGICFWTAYFFTVCKTIALPEGPTETIQPRAQRSA